MKSATTPIVALTDAQARILWVSRTQPPLKMAEVVGQKLWTWDREPGVVKRAFAEALLHSEPQTFVSSTHLNGELVRWEAWFWPLGLGNVAMAVCSFPRATGPLPTSRELAVLKLLCAGRKPHEAASELKISVNTAYTYIARLKTKARQRTVAGVVNFATAAGWL